MSRTTTLITVLIVALLLVLVVPVMAGGWAVVTVDSLPKDVHAGDNVHLEFTVLQHGEKPVHTVDFMNGEPLTPFLMARHLDTGQTVRVEALPAKEIGRFTVAVVFPIEGTWQWEITPHPLEGTIQLEPLAVQAPMTVGSTVSEQTLQAEETVDTVPRVSTPTGRATLRGSALVLLLAAAVTALLALRQRRQPSPLLTPHSD